MIHIHVYINYYNFKHLLINNYIQSGLLLLVVKTELSLVPEKSDSSKFETNSLTLFACANFALFMKYYFNNYQSCQYTTREAVNMETDEKEEKEYLNMKLII